MRIVTFSLILFLLLSTLGCAGMNRTQQRMLSGAAIGTAAGVGTAAIVGGSLATGAVVGAAAGTVGGLVVDSIERH